MCKAFRYNDENCTIRNRLSTEMKTFGFIKDVGKVFVNFEQLDVTEPNACHSTFYITRISDLPLASRTIIRNAHVC